MIFAGFCGCGGGKLLTLISELAEHDSELVRLRTWNVDIVLRHLGEKELRICLIRVEGMSDES
jgi:hypothetical protein